MPLISVVIPAYNAAPTLGATLASVLAQTWQDFEILVIDNGSDDDTGAIAHRFGDPRLQVLRQGALGVARARNAGLERARGDYIAFLDSDDLWTPDKLADQLAALAAAPEAALAYSWTDYIDEQDQFLFPGSHITASGDVYAQLFVNNFLENGSNPLVRRSALAAVGPFDPDLPPAEDWDLWLRLAARYPFVAVAKAQVLYRLSSRSASSNLARMERQCLVVLQRARERRPDLPAHLDRASLAHLYEYLTFRALAGKPGRHHYRQAARYFSQLLRYDAGILKRRSRLMAITGGKILLGNVLPPPWLHRWQKSSA